MIVVFGFLIFYHQRVMTRAPTAQCQDNQVLRMEHSEIEGQMDGGGNRIEIVSSALSRPSIPKDITGR